MAGINPKQWKVGQMCTVRSLLATIENIVPSMLGICMYEVKFVDSGHIDTVPKHMLQEIEGFDEEDESSFLANVDALPEEICASDSTRGCKPTQYSRFLHVSEEDIDEVAKSRLSKHTEYQTSWAVNLFKGM